MGILTKCFPCRSKASLLDSQQKRGSWYWYNFCLYTVALDAGGCIAARDLTKLTDEGKYKDYNTCQRCVWYPCIVDELIKNKTKAGAAGAATGAAAAAALLPSGGSVVTQPLALSF